MMKKSTKLLALVLALSTVAPIAACGTVVEEAVPEDRIEIKISLYSGGYGTEWMDNLISHVNKKQETYWYTRLEDNKTASDEITGRIMGDRIDADIYFTTPADVEELVINKKLESLKEVYEYTPEGESLTIKEKTRGYDMYEKYLSDTDGVYVMPTQYEVNGLVYDHDLFIKNGWLRTDSNTASGLTKGSDGVEGTYDDGLPETYAQFKNLVEQISADQCTPFIYADQVGFSQMRFFLEGVWGQYEGEENYNVGASYNGTYISPSTGKQTSVTPAEGWKVYANNLQEGRWKAMQLASELLKGSKYMYDDQKGLSHTDAQGIYIISHKSQSRIAMLFDGGWWENEAKRPFAEDAKENGEGYAFGKRDFRMMPAPSFDGQVESSNGKHYFSGGVGGSAFAVKQSDEVKRKGVIDFFKEYASDWNCKQYTKSSGCMLPFKYEMTKEEMGTISKYAQNAFEILSSESTVLISNYWQEKGINLPIIPERWGNVVIDGATHGSHWLALNASGVTFNMYKDGVLNRTYTQANWGEKTN